VSEVFVSGEMGHIVREAPTGSTSIPATSPVLSREGSASVNQRADVGHRKLVVARSRLAVRPDFRGTDRALQGSADVRFDVEDAIAPSDLPVLPALCRTRLCLRPCVGLNQRILL
jgi:hypothetical protein